MISIRGGSGLGDSLYVQAIARHLMETRGVRIEACSNWPDVFRPLVETGRCAVSPFRRQRIDRLAHYSTRRDVTRTTQFEDCCISAGINEPVDLRLDWTIANPELVGRLKETGRPVVLLQMARSPMDRKDGYGAELLPDCAIIQRAIDRIRPHAMVVQVGAGKPLHEFSGVDVNLANRTGVAELLDVAMMASGFLGYVSYFVPLSESFLKPALFVWSRRGLNSRNQLIRQITPQKILHRASGRCVIDDCTDRELTGSVDAFLEKVRGAALV